MSDLVGNPEDWFSHIAARDHQHSGTNQQIACVLSITKFGRSLMCPDGYTIHNNIVSFVIQRVKGLFK